jgi:hypothetical protein
VVIVIASVIAGAVLAGSIAVLLLLLLGLALVSAGILSTSIVVGLYKRSFTAGFRVFLLLFCSMAGLATGGLGLWLINRFFHLHWIPRIAALTGAGGGFIGGLLLGLVLFILIRVFLKYCRQKLSF